MKLRGFETERLVVRPLRLSDHATCVATLHNSLLPRRQREGELLTLSQLGSSHFSKMLELRENWAASDRRYLLSAFLRENGCFIGDTMLFNVFRDPYARAEIGTVVASEYQQFGLGTELISGTLKWGWNELDLEEIKGFIEDDNPQSTTACLRSGFSLITSCPIFRIFEGEIRWGWPIIIRRPHKAQF